MRPLNETKARRLLRELPYDQRLPVGRMMIPKGVHHSRIGSLEELEWTMRPTAKTLVIMRFENLERWLRESVGDEYLADIVKETMIKNTPYVEQSKTIYEALTERVKTLRRAADREVDHA